MDLMEATMKRERQFLITWIYSQIYDHRIRLHASILGVQRFLEEWLIYPPKALVWHDLKERYAIKVEHEETMDNKDYDVKEGNELNSGLNNGEKWDDKMNGIRTKMRIRVKGKKMKQLVY